MKKTYYEQNKAKILAYNKEWKKNNPEKMRLYRRKWDEKNQDYYENYCVVRGEEYGSYQKAYRIKNRKKLSRNMSIYLCEKYKTDLMFHIGENMRISIYKALRGKTKTGSWKKLVGYNVDELKKHLEKQFDENMSWENYGKYWQIDHIIPKTWFIFKSSNDIGFKMCWDLDNLQPLEKIQNIKKGNRFIYC